MDGCFSIGLTYCSVYKNDNVKNPFRNSSSLKIYKRFTKYMNLKIWCVQCALLHFI